MKNVMFIILMMVGLMVPLLASKIFYKKWDVGKNILLGMYTLLLYYVLGTIIHLVHGYSGLHTKRFMGFLEIMGFLVYMLSIIILNRYTIKDKLFKILVCCIPEYIYFLLCYYLIILRYLSMTNVHYGV